MWRWMAAQMANHSIVMASIALTEVGHVAPECAQWLEDKGIGTLPITDLILQDALPIN